MPLSWDFTAHRFACLVALINISRDTDGTEGDVNRVVRSLVDRLSVN
jgi:hypothetical protein